MKLDRLTRSLKDLSELLERYFQSRFRLLSVSEQIDTSTAAGRMMLNVLTAISQWEREAAAERTQAVMAHLKSSGRYTGGFPPFGFRVDEEGALVPNEAEQETIATVKYLRAQGQSYRKIASQLVNTRTGKLFDHKQIERML
jgi:site-specific DNA recombinase